MINEYYLLAILIVHFIADFVLQTDKQAKGKSTSIEQLLSHTLSYSLVFFLIGNFINLTWFEIMSEFNLCLFFLITFVAHTITDFVTSRVGKIYWDKGNTHIGFIVIGFDQILHYVQLYLTLKFLL